MQLENFSMEYCSVRKRVFIQINSLWKCFHSNIFFFNAKYFNNTEAFPFNISQSAFKYLI